MITTDCLADPRGDRSIVGWFTAATLPSTPCACHIGVLCGEDGGVAAEADGRLLSSFCEGTEGLRRVGLIRADARDFPVQVSVLDAQYVYRPLGNRTPAVDENKPYFDTLIEKGRFVGISPTADGRQFNAAYRPRKSEDDPFDFYKYFFGA